MVGVTIDCRFGNQLFQYAFIKSLSKKFKTSFYINETIERFMLPEYFHLEGYNPFLNKLNWAMLKIRSGKLLKPLNSNAVNSFNPPETGVFTDKQIYTGYFQSELFFTNIKDNISSYIRLKTHHVNQFQSKYKELFAGSRVVAVHVRRGDYLNLNQWWLDNLASTDLTLPAGYYLKALGQIKQIERCKLIFVSDDIAYARSAFGHLKNAEFAENSMIVDFQVIMNADICILSNSSFSWWAAYLNQKKDKEIYCPQYWLGFKVEREYPAGIIPAGWKQIKAGD